MTPSLRSILIIVAFAFSAMVSMTSLMVSTMPVFSAGAVVFSAAGCSVFSVDVCPSAGSPVSALAPSSDGCAAALVSAAAEVSVSPLSAVAPVSGRITIDSPAIPLVSVLGSIAVSVDGCIAASSDGCAAASLDGSVAAAEVSGAGVSSVSSIPLTSRVLITPLMTLSAFATLMPFSSDSPFSSRLKVRPASA